MKPITLKKLLLFLIIIISIQISIQIGMNSSLVAAKSNISTLKFKVNAKSKKTKTNSSNLNKSQSKTVLKVLNKVLKKLKVKEKEILTAFKKETPNHHHKKNNSDINLKSLNAIREKKKLVGEEITLFEAAQLLGLNSIKMLGVLQDLKRYELESKYLARDSSNNNDVIENKQNDKNLEGINRKLDSNSNINKIRNRLQVLDSKDLLLGHKLKKIVGNSLGKTLDYEKIDTEKEIKFLESLSRGSNSNDLVERTIKSDGLSKLSTVGDSNKLIIGNELVNSKKSIKKEEINNLIRKTSFSSNITDPQYNLKVTSNTNKSNIENKSTLAKEAVMGSNNSKNMLRNPIITEKSYSNNNEKISKRKNSDKSNLPKEILINSSDLFKNIQAFKKNTGEEMKVDKQRLLINSFNKESDIDKKEISKNENNLLGNSNSKNTLVYYSKLRDQIRNEIKKQIIRKGSVKQEIDKLEAKKQNVQKYLNGIKGDNTDSKYEQDSKTQNLSKSKLTDNNNDSNFNENENKKMEIITPNYKMTQINEPNFSFLQKKTKKLSTNSNSKLKEFKKLKHTNSAKFALKIASLRINDLKNENIQLMENLNFEERLLKKLDIKIINLEKELHQNKKMLKIYKNQLSEINSGKPLIELRKFSRNVNTKTKITEDFTKNQ